MKLRLQPDGGDWIWRPLLYVAVGCLLLMACCAFCQRKLQGQITAHLSPQPSRLRGITAYAVQLCAEVDTVLPGGKVYAAVQPKIRWISRAEAQQAISSASRHSLPKHIVQVCGYLLLAGAALSEGKVVRIKERFRSALPVGGAALELLQSRMKEEVPLDHLPDNFLAPLIQIPARGCVEAVLFGQTQQNEIAFSVEIR